MFSARILSRSIRLPIHRSFTRSISFKPQQSVLKSTWRNTTPLIRQTCLAAQFSTSLGTPFKQGAVDDELTMKLESELNLETEMKDDMPAVLQEFIDRGPFKINDTLGSGEVELVRKFGDETIRVVFCIDDLHSMEEDDSFNDESFEEDGAVSSAQSGGAQSTTAKDESRVSSADDTAEEEFAEDNETSFPARLDITIEKPNQGALQIEAVAQDGIIVIENVNYHKNASLASAQTAEANWEKNRAYGGPPFGHLDEELQVLLERYLDERGIDTSLALFLPDYIDYKEQREYMNWLENVKNFVEA